MFLKMQKTFITTQHSNTTTFLLFCFTIIKPQIINFTDIFMKS